MCHTTQVSDVESIASPAGRVELSRKLALYRKSKINKEKKHGQNGKEDLEKHKANPSMEKQNVHRF
jgi:hypothetical protein